MPHARTIGPLIAVIVLIGFTAIPTAAQIQVTVQANQGPWSQALNPNYAYGLDDNADPVAISAANGISFTQGGAITVAYMSGTVSVCGGCSYADANGNFYLAANNLMLGGDGKDPSYFMNPYPIYAGELVATFANKGVIEGTPFTIGDGPKTFLIPAGANQLLLGINDNYFADNAGSFTLSISSQPREPIAASAPSQFVGLTGSVSFAIAVEWGVPYSGNDEGFAGDVTLSISCSTGIDLSLSSPVGINASPCNMSGNVAQITLPQPSKGGQTTLATLTVTAELDAPANQLATLTVCGLPSNSSASYCLGPQIEAQDVVGLNSQVDFTGLSATSSAPICSSTLGCFDIQQNFFVFDSTDANGYYPSYWVQNVLIVMNDSKQGWEATPIFELWNTTSVGTANCIIDTNFTTYTGQCQSRPQVNSALERYLHTAPYTRINRAGTFLPLGLQSTISPSGDGDEIGLTTFAGGSSLASFTSSVTLLAGSLISAGQGQSLGVRYEPELALVGIPSEPVNFGMQTAGIISSQLQLAQSWVSAFQTPFVQGSCSSTGGSSAGLLWTKDGSTFNSSEPYQGEGITFVPGTGKTCQLIQVNH